MMMMMRYKRGLLVIDLAYMVPAMNGETLNK